MTITPPAVIPLPQGVMRSSTLWGIIKSYCAYAQVNNDHRRVTGSGIWNIYIPTI